MAAPTGDWYVLYGRKNLRANVSDRSLGRLTLFTNNLPLWKELPWEFEAGTPNMAGAIGLGAAIDYLEELGMDQVEAHEQD